MIGKRVYSKNYGYGTVTHVDEDYGIILISLDGLIDDDGTEHFKNGHLTNAFKDGQKSLYYKDPEVDFIFIEQGK